MTTKRRFNLCVLTLLLLVTGFFVQDASAQQAVCPLSQGYWANNSQSWATTNLMLGTQFYNQGELQALIPGGGGDASTILAAQLIAAKLNIAAGADPAPASAAILQGDMLLGQQTGKLPYNIDPSSAAGQEMVNTAGVLDSFNNGQLTPDCAPTPTVTPDSTQIPIPPLVVVIQGFVQQVNVNVITIAGINIAVHPDDPMLAVIQVGAPLRVEGTASTDDQGNLLIIASGVAAAPPGVTTQTLYIQGRVDAVNINIITIAGISIQVDPGSPVLASIQPGDYVQVNANIQIDDDSIVVLVATTVIVIVNVVPDSVPTQTPTTTPPTPTPEGTPAASPTPTGTAGLPVTIIVEGPVQVVNVNIITIYDIDITVNADDPVLTSIQVGDFVRVEGDMVTQGNTIMIVAINIFVVDIDVIVSNDNTIIWRDDNNCGNPPPPWAPAHGWRRRCEGPRNSGNWGSGRGSFSGRDS